MWKGNVFAISLDIDSLSKEMIECQITMSIIY